MVTVKALMLSLSAPSVFSAVSAKRASNLNILRLHDQSHGAAPLSGFDNQTGRIAVPNEANVNSEHRVDSDDSYRAVCANLSQELTWSVAQDLVRSSRTQPSQPADIAFFEAAFVVVSQLATIEAGIEEQRLSDVALHSEVRQPFVLGYTFGAAAAAIERQGIGRTSAEANSIIVRLTRVVLRDDTFEDCVTIHNAAMADPEYGDGMSKAGDDADRLATDRERPYGLLPWLGPRLRLTPLSPSRQFRLFRNEALTLTGGAQQPSAGQVQRELRGAI